MRPRHRGLVELTGLKLERDDSQLLRLEKDWRSPVRKEADLTFRVLVILKYQWERQIRMLDRRDDGYTI